MSDVAIRVRNLGKQYRIGVGDDRAGMYRYKSLRDTLSGFVHSPVRAVRKQLAGDPLTGENSFWALDDVNFEIGRGEVVGIIGHNGAGKSTLLKILSRVAKPTTGTVDLYGRVGSLLEVGTGFHPELTGRENIYLNGSILGMTRAEIRAKFDEIVAFSEIDRFLDTPVKQYSSGMYARLAFAVAAHLDPEILVVDEVLAVGDAAFQRKCLGKMKDVASVGRTVLFVSHNVAALLSLCPRSIYLERGRVKRIGDTASIVADYAARSRSGQSTLSQTRPAGQDADITALSITPDEFESGDDAMLAVSITSRTEDVIATHVCVLIYTLMGTRVGIVDLRRPEGPYRIAAGQTLTLTSTVKNVPLTEGTYSLGLYVSVGYFADNILDITTFTIAPSANETGIPPYEPDARGVVRIEATPPVTIGAEPSVVGT